MLRKISTFASVYEKRSVMDAEKPSVEELIATVLTDIQQKGYSSIQPFDIGEVEDAFRWNYTMMVNVLSILMDSPNSLFIRTTK